MRDPGRIHVFCDKLARIWGQVPDWRFGQLIANLFAEYTAETGMDCFYAEDDKMIAFFETYIETYATEGSAS